ncbi:GntR family transcriptional regulator [Pseudonocardia sp. ICBG1293]|uniref:GntR family transcriptional regulator n=1 Tax=Pseudonocardia sp. ICBG1293 TaxID=2844382 RepID=UPI001CCFFCA3|nr:GntR family transcriptional regulator [Pseudonocardia sp. ICBG1293]
MSDPVGAPVDRGSPVPLYFQVATRLRAMVESGQLPAGSRLPGESELVGRLGATRPTLRRAVSYLVEQGVLARKRGAGTRVLPPPPARPVDLTGLHDDLLRAGRAPRTVLRGCTTGPVDDGVARALGVPPGTVATRIERLRLADGEPLALMTNVVPVSVLPLRTEDLVAHGLYALLRSAGHAPRRARQIVGARAATAQEAAALGEAAGAPLLRTVRTAWDESGHAVEHGVHLHRPDRHTIEIGLPSGAGTPAPG